MWASIKRGKVLMHCKNTIFIYHSDFSKYMKVEGAISEEIFDYLFKVGAESYLLEKEKKYLCWKIGSIASWNEDFDDYLENDGLEDNVWDEGMQNLNMDD